MNKIQEIPTEVYAQDPEPERACRVCGCTEHDPCLHEIKGPCWWAEGDLCSHCKYWPGKSMLYSELITAGAYAD